MRLFSNLFLFDAPCDDAWIDAARQEAGPAVRPPVAWFNAGCLQHRSYEAELESIAVPTLILQGMADPRKDDRQKYVDLLAKGEIVTIDRGNNVLPWEAPVETVAVIRAFLHRDGPPPHQE